MRKGANTEGLKMLLVKNAFVSNVLGKGATPEKCIDCLILMSSASWVIS